MKTWKNAVIEELEISSTEHGYWGIHSDGNRAQSDMSSCKNKTGNYGTIYGYHNAHPDAPTTTPTPTPIPETPTDLVS